MSSATGPVGFSGEGGSTGCAEQGEVGLVGFDCGSGWG